MRCKEIILLLIFRAALATHCVVSALITINVWKGQLTSTVKFLIENNCLGCKPSNWFHSQGNQPLCPLPDVTSEDPLKDVQPKKIVDDGSKPKETPPPPQEPDEEKELIRKVFDSELF